MKEFPYAERGGPLGRQYRYPDDEFDNTGALTVDGSLLWRDADVVGDPIVGSGAVIAGRYFGGLALNDHVPAIRYNLVPRVGDFILLFDKSVYRALEKEAHPKGNNTGDDDALIFFEVFLAAANINLQDPAVIAAFAHFVTESFMTQQQSDDLLQGVPF